MVEPKLPKNPPKNLSRALVLELCTFAQKHLAPAQYEEFVGKLEKKPPRKKAVPAKTPARRNKLPIKTRLDKVEGFRLSRKTREAVAGLTIEDALRDVVRNGRVRVRNLPKAPKSGKQKIREELGRLLTFCGHSLKS